MKRETRYYNKTLKMHREISQKSSYKNVLHQRTTHQLPVPDQPTHPTQPHFPHSPQGAISPPYQNPQHSSRPKKQV